MLLLLCCLSQIHLLHAHRETKYGRFLSNGRSGKKFILRKKKNNLMEDFSSTADVTRSSFWILFEDKLTDKLSYWCLNMLVYDPPKQTIQVQDVRLWPQPTTQIQNNFPLVFLTTAVREWSPLPCVSWGRLMVCGQMSRLREQKRDQEFKNPSIPPAA